MSATFDRSGPRRLNASAGAGGKSSYRPASGPLTLATSSSLHLLTNLERQLCATLRILPRPYLFLKEVLLREWTYSGKGMGIREARRAVLQEAARGAQDAGGEEPREEWLEKIDRVWEFLRDSGGLRKVIPEDEEEEGEGEGEGMEGVEADGGEGVAAEGTPPPPEGPNGTAEVEVAS